MKGHGGEGWKEKIQRLMECDTCWDGCATNFLHSGHILCLGAVLKTRRASSPPGVPQVLFTTTSSAAGPLTGFTHQPPSFLTKLQLPFRPSHQVLLLLKFLFTEGSLGSTLRAFCIFAVCTVPCSIPRSPSLHVTGGQFEGIPHGPITFLKLKKKNQLD